MAGKRGGDLGTGFSRSHALCAPVKLSSRGAVRLPVGRLVPPRTEAHTVPPFKVPGAHLEVHSRIFFIKKRLENGASPCTNFDECKCHRNT